MLRKSDRCVSRAHLWNEWQVLFLNFLWGTIQPLVPFNQSFISAPKEVSGVAFQIQRHLLGYVVLMDKVTVMQKDPSCSLHPHPWVWSPNRTGQPHTITFLHSSGNSASPRSTPWPDFLASEDSTLQTLLYLYISGICTVRPQRYLPCLAPSSPWVWRLHGFQCSGHEQPGIWLATTASSHP